MRRLFAAFAWIERETLDGPRVLTQWNRKWQAFNLVGGNRESDESFRECVVREIMEELGLVESQFEVAAEPVGQIAFSAHSVPEEEVTAYTMVLFRAAILDASAFHEIEKTSVNRWLSREELAAGVTADQNCISEVTARFFASIGNS